MTNLALKEYKVLFDGQKSGYDASGGSVIYANGELYLLFQKASDGEKGLRPLMTKSADLGETWTTPETFGPDILKDPQNEFMALGLCGPTKKGTTLCIGVHLQKGISTGNYVDTVKWRPGTAIIGRKEKGEENFTYQYYSTGTFLGEQFVGSGIVLSSGRVVLTIWGAKEQNENWRCGVLISDDDGLSWKYSDVGYEPDLSIRNNPVMPAGFNEQTLYETQDGDLISLIRGREKLGMVKDSPRDTWFFRSISKDRGETWSNPEITDIAGTGAAGYGLTLFDGSLIHACRIPYHRQMYFLEEPSAYGLHIARSIDKGKTWKTVLFKQRDPAGRIFDNYYNAMNGQFISIDENRCIYVFGQFHHRENIHRVLALDFYIE